MLLESTTPAIAIASPRRSALTFGLITKAADLEALTPAWQDLVKASSTPEPMLAPAWLVQWWRTYGNARELCVGTIRDGARLVGLAPLCRSRYWHRPGIPFTRLEFVGADVDEQDGVCSEYLGLVTHAGYEDSVRDLFIREANRGAFGAWDEIVLSSMNGGDPSVARLEAGFRDTGCLADQQVHTESPYLTLPATWEGYLASLEKKRRNNIKRALLDFEAWAGNAWNLEQACTPDDLARGQAILRSLHGERWNSHGAFASSRFTAFHDAYMPQALADGALDLFWISVRGEPVAVHYQLVANRKAYFYQCGRKLDVPEKVRIGIVLVSLAIKRAIEQGLREYDFLGGPAFYKMQMTSTTRPIVNLRLARPGLRESARRAAACAIDWARGLRQLLKR